MSELPPPERVTVPLATRLVHPVSPRNVAVLNALFFCIGYVALRQWKKGVTSITLALLLGPATFGVMTVVIALLAAVDGYMQAGVMNSGAAIGQWTFFRGRVK